MKNLSILKLLDYPRSRAYKAVQEVNDLKDAVSPTNTTMTKLKPNESNREFIQACDRKY
jgi:hypothetical protein